MTISFIVPTLGRPSLARTLASIETALGDEILVVSDGPTPAASIIEASCLHVRYLEHGPDHRGGSPQRQAGMAVARGDYLAFIDDDDAYVPGHRAIMAHVMAEYPDRPVVFRMTYAATGHTLWHEPVIRQGNVGTPMFLVPNDPARLGVWSDRYEADFDFLTSGRWPAESVVWRPDVIAAIGVAA